MATTPSRMPRTLTANCSESRRWSTNDSPPRSPRPGPSGPAPGTWRAICRSSLPMASPRTGRGWSPPRTWRGPEHRAWRSRPSLVSRPSSRRPATTTPWAGSTGTYHGQPILSHSGGTLGFVSEVAFLPEADLGIVLLTNGGQGAGTFNLAVQFRLLELLFDQPAEFDAMLGPVPRSPDGANRRAASPPRDGRPGSRCPVPGALPAPGAGRGRGGAARRHARL